MDKSYLYDLKVNSKEQPLGMDDDTICFGWKLHTAKTRIRQKNCRVQVFEEDSQSLIWDSGICHTEESVYFPYRGERLKACTRYRWKVEVTDSDACSYEGSALFETGLKCQKKEGWEGAQFIGSAENSINTDSLECFKLETAFVTENSKKLTIAWNVRDQDNYLALEMDLAAKKCYVYRKDDGAWENIEASRRILGAAEGYPMKIDSFQETACGTLELEVHGTELSVAMNHQTVIGKEKILPKNKPFTPRIEGMGNLGILNRKGKCSLKNFKVSYPENGQEKVLKEYETIEVENDFYVWNPSGAVYVRRFFEIDRKVKCARLYATARGFYDAYINGEKAGDSFYNPGFTDYRKRLMYQTYDITPFLREGKNVIGAVVKKGYYTGYVGYTEKPMVYGRQNSFLAKMIIEYADGSCQTVVTDQSWEFTGEGSVINADYQQGEVADSRREIDWNTAKFSKCGVHQWPERVIPTNGELSETEEFLITAQSGEEARIERVLLPIKDYVEQPKGHFVFDLGQNMVGTVRLTVCGTGNRGTSIKLRYGEMCYPDGKIYLANLRSAANTDCYTMAGKKKEIFLPTGTSHGFRYIELSGNGFELKKEDLDQMLIALEGLVITNTPRMAGSFQCSNEEVNQLQSNIVWGQRDNSLLVYTDCPQRNERMGWTGDAQVFVSTAAYNMDIKTFMEKWLMDLRDAQQLYNRHGAVPDTAPLGGDNRKTGGCAGWGDAAVIVPWKLYLATGDRRILEENYEMMRAWVEYQSRNDRQFRGIRTVDDRAAPECSDLSEKSHLQIQQSRGDHLTFDASTPFILTATAYAAYVAGLLSRIAGILGKTEDEERYHRRSEKVKKAFNEAWVCEDGSIAYWGEMSKSETDDFGNVINQTRYAETNDRTRRPSQTAYALAIDFDLIPKEKMEHTKRCLKRAIEDRGGKLSVGFLGIEHLMPALCKAGFYDLAFSLMEENEFPSWLYSVKNGATTIWERWNSYVAETGTFGEVSMNSFNHYAYGAIGAWLYDTVAGIRSAEDEDGAGYKKIILRPHIGGSLTFAEAWHDSPYGRIYSGYKIEDGVLNYRCIIPANTSAVLYLPFTEEEKELGSGTYEFQIVFEM